MIEDKAKTLSEISIEEVIGDTAEQPSIITIRLDKDFEQRFNELAASLGINRVQVLRNLLTGDNILLSGVCKKANAIKIKPIKTVEPEQNTSPQYIANNSPAKTLNDSDEVTEPQTRAVLPPQFRNENEPTTIKPKRGRKKKIPSSVDYTEERQQIIDYLNLKTRKSFGYTSEESIASLDKMLTKGRTVEEFKRIIDNVVPLWIDN